MQIYSNMIDVLGKKQFEHNSFALCIILSETSSGGDKYGQVCLLPQAK